jgi:hypothetical protein
MLAAVIITEPQSSVCTGAAGCLMSAPFFHLC